MIQSPAMQHIAMGVNSAGKCVKSCMRSWDWRKSQCYHTAQKGQVRMCVCVAMTGTETEGQGRILSKNWGSTSTTWVCWMPWWILQEFPHSSQTNPQWLLRVLMLDTLFYLLPNLSYVTLPSVVEYALLSLHLFLCSALSAQASLQLSVDSGQFSPQYFSHISRWNLSDCLHSKPAFSSKTVLTWLTRSW